MLENVEIGSFEGGFALGLGGFSFVRGGFALERGEKRAACGWKALDFDEFFAPKRLCLCLICTEKSQKLSEKFDGLRNGWILWIFDSFDSFHLHSHRNEERRCFEWKNCISRALICEWTYLLGLMRNREKSWKKFYVSWKWCLICCIDHSLDSFELISWRMEEIDCSGMKTSNFDAMS